MYPLAGRDWLDVLVHGEYERNDMVEYFGESLGGFLFTKLGWVQSYGTRCDKTTNYLGRCVPRQTDNCGLVRICTVTDR